MRTNLNSEFFLNNKKAILLPFFVCVSLFFILTIIFDLDGPYLTDLVVCLVASYVLYIVLKDNIFYVINVLFMLFVLYAINKLKTQYFGSPVQASDILSVVALYDIQTPLLKILSLTVLLLMFVFFVINLRYVRTTLYTFILILLFAPIGYLYAYTNSTCLTSARTCVNASNTQSSSAIAQFSVSLVQLYRELFSYPTKGEVGDAKQIVDSGTVSLTKYYSEPINNKRNVYFILVESLFDPEAVGGLKFSADPFYKKFRELWQKTGNSRALSPVFGGGTANPEFELLCGIPLTSNVIKFELPVLNSNLPCLPNLLHSNGYVSAANHPNISGFWNRDSAYPKLGFKSYYSIDDFEKDEILSNTYLSDRSLFRQAYAHTANLNKPIFNYVLTAAEHYPYLKLADKDEAIRVLPKNEYLSRYVNLVYRGTKAVYEYYKKIVTNDPDAIVVILGDHLPMLGKDFTPYREEGYFHGTNDTNPQKVINMHAVPLIIADGKRGPLPIGTISTYEIPILVTELLHDQKLSLNILRQSGVGDSERYRPLAGYGVLYTNDNVWRYCKIGSDRSECKQPLSWLHAARILDKDITVGSKLSYMKPIAMSP